MEKLLPMERIFEILKPNVFHQPENPFPLARTKDLFQKYVSTRRKKKTGINVWYPHKSPAENV